VRVIEPYDPAAPAKSRDGQPGGICLAGRLCISLSSSLCNGGARSWRGSSLRTPWTTRTAGAAGDAVPIDYCRRSRTDNSGAMIRFAELDARNSRRQSGSSASPRFHGSPFATRRPVNLFAALSLALARDPRAFGSDTPRVEETPAPGLGPAHRRTRKSALDLHVDKIAPNDI
jgi:hypothetical protein